MEDADRLCELLFLWLEEQKPCAKDLLALAEQPESHQSITMAQIASGAICTAAIAATVSPALAFPVIAAASTVSFPSKVTESGLLEATDIKKVEKIEDEIQMKLTALKENCGRRKMEAHSSTDSSDVRDCELNTQIMAALARKDKVNVPEDLLRSFNKATRFHQSTLDGDEPSITSDMMVEDGLLELSLKVSISMKTIIEQTFRVAGFSLYDYIQNLSECNKAEASQSLRDAVKRMEEHANKLKEKLKEQRDIIKKLSELKTLIKDLGEYSFARNKKGNKIVNYIIATCHDPDIYSWLKKNSHQTHLLNLLRFVRDNLLNELEEKIQSQSLKKLHIVFVAHGGITGKFWPPSVLVPTDSIIDTILYSPWNCAINAKVAYGIATGDIKLTDRRFRRKGKENETVTYVPPENWNSMRRSEHNIPKIHLGSMDPTEDRAWQEFKEHVPSDGNLYNEGRIIIPFTMPKVDPESRTRVPFYVLIFVTSFILSLTDVKATVHLAACLGRLGYKRQEKWEEQYSCTDDNIFMTLEREKVDDYLFRALSEMFDRF